jgi:hypothetical protein
MSLADILAQNQGGGGSSIKQRTNRFWTYIGNNHMAQHPEMYSAEELAKFAANAAAKSADASTPSEGTFLSFGSSTLTNASEASIFQKLRDIHELEARDPPRHELYEGHNFPKQREIEEALKQAAQRHDSAQQSPPPSTRFSQRTIDSVYEHPNGLSNHPTNINDNEYDDGSSTYSGEEEEAQVQVAQASPVMQVRPSMSTLRPPSSSTTASISTTTASAPPAPASASTTLAPPAPQILIRTSVDSDIDAVLGLYDRDGMSIH